MRVLQRFTTEPHVCHYLPDREARMEYQYVSRLSPAEYESLMDGGFRKFGPLLFQPVCAGCRACRPIRIPVDRFRPDRSQRRNAAANAGLEVRYGTPGVDETRLRLYQRYHAAQAERKGWPEQEKDPDEYAFSFVHNPLPAAEITLWDGDRLVGVVLTEVTPNVLSGIYHYWEPELAARGLGTFCMLQTLELARRLDKRWAYFGYYVAGCGSLAYKARFRPCELLHEDGVWREFDWEEAARRDER